MDESDQKGGYHRRFSAPDDPKRGWLFDVSKSSLYASEITKRLESLRSSLNGAKAQEKVDYWKDRLITMEGDGYSVTIHVNSHLRDGKIAYEGEPHAGFGEVEVKAVGDASFVNRVKGVLESQLPDYVENLVPCLIE
ncbi:MAG: hypothetical protein V1731_01460 [Candidatus Aenigmatarchaeota archaeon]